MASAHSSADIERQHHQALESWFTCHKGGALHYNTDDTPEKVPRGGIQHSVVHDSSTCDWHISFQRKPYNVC